MTSKPYSFYPLFFTPVIKNYMWGGRNLQKYNRQIPAGKPAAESWEIAAHKDGMSVVTNGTYTGYTLQELLNLLGEELVGENNRWAIERGLFPLMVKIIDAEQRLSVQVHPDDEYAKAHEGNELGKAEMWVVLEAKPDASIVYGFSKKTTPDSLMKSFSTGNFEEFLNLVPIKKGDHICVSTGTMHAIMEGSLLIEIQQNSNTTYRVFDWNRKDNRGQERPLHINKALDVINFNQVNLGLPGSETLINTDDFTRELLCSNTYFSVERFTCQQEFYYQGNCDGSTLEIWGVINGQADIAGEYVEAIQFCLLPAKLGKFKIHAEPGTILLRAYSGEPGH